MNVCDIVDYVHVNIETSIMGMHRHLTLAWNVVLVARHEGAVLRLPRLVCQYIEQCVVSLTIKDI